MMRCVRIIGIVIGVIVITSQVPFTAAQQDEADLPKNIALSPNGEMIAVAYGSGKVEIWDRATQTLLHTLTAHTDTAFPIAWNEDSTSLLTGSADATIRQWDVATWANTMTIELSQYQDVLDTDWNGDHSQIIAAVTTGGVICFDATTGAELSSASVGGYVLEMVWSPDEQYIAFPTNGGFIQIADSQTLEHVTELGDQSLHGEQYSYARHMLWAVWSPDGSMVGGATRLGLAQVWRVSDNAPILAPTEITDLWLGIGIDMLPRAIVFSPDGQYFQAVSADGTLAVWNLSTGERVQSVSISDEYIYAASFSTDGRQLIYTVGDGIAPLEVDLPAIPLSHTKPCCE
ncbi:MAG TPA: WD40 repeat domain-containing protein [Aggregatilineaceae bacterium]|nr:WD40 repeat domain-containing protein [Aggregatilineaceae bacterium]